jgi:hypothetical protein
LVDALTLGALNLPTQARRLIAQIRMHQWLGTWISLAINVRRVMNTPTENANTLSKPQ